jgi:hypothetical protein
LKRGGEWGQKVRQLGQTSEDSSQALTAERPKTRREPAGEESS